MLKFQTHNKDNCDVDERLFPGVATTVENYSDQDRTEVDFASFWMIKT